MFWKKRPSQLDRIERKVNEIMPGLADVKAALAAEREDLAALAALITAILAAVAAGQLSAADAQGLLDTINADDSSIKGNIAAIQAALPVPPAKSSA